MTKLVILGSLAALFALTGQCASVVITTSTSCSTDQGSVIAPSACNLSGTPDGSASADASASYSISGNTLTLTLADQASAEGTVLPGAPTGASNFASAQSSISIDIVTEGPVRPGIVIPIDNGYALGDGRTSPNGSVAGGTASLFSIVGFMCNDVSSCNYGGPSGYRGNGYPIQITLGTDFGVTTAMASAIAEVYTLDFGVTGAFGEAGAGLNLQFFEADGVTPVAIALATPEPSLGAFTGFLSLFIAGSWAIRRNGERPTECLDNRC